MKFLSISDTHSKHGFIPESWLEPADCIIHAGDISTRGYEHEVLNFLTWFSSLKQYKYKIFIAGNHDWYFQDNPSKIKDIMAQFPDVIYLKDSGVTIEGIKIWGSPIQPEFFQWAFNRQRGPEIKKHWDIIPSDSDIIVTHGPVFRQCDQVLGVYHSPNNGEHVGCSDLKDAVERIKPKFHICGHIHCGYGTSTNGVTTFINAATVNEEYLVTNEPIKFEINI